MSDVQVMPQIMLETRFNMVAQNHAPRMRHFPIAEPCPFERAAVQPLRAELVRRIRAARTVGS